VYDDVIGAYGGKINKFCLSEETELAELKIKKAML